MQHNNNETARGSDSTTSILILYGGCSTEHEVSCNSAATILAAFADLSYTPELCGISKDGIWYYQDANTQLQHSKKGLALSIETDAPVLSIVPGRGIFIGTKELACSCVFPVLHGLYGEDGSLQGLLEHAQLPYVGADVASSVLGINKKYCKIVWKEAGLPVAPFLSFDKHVDCSEIRELICDHLQFPVFVKPNCAGSSVGITKVRDKASIKAALDMAFAYDDVIIVENGLQAREIEVSVTGNHNVEVFSPGELITKHEFYSYEAKYGDSEGTQTEIPAQLKPEIKKRIQQLARQAYNCIGCMGLARVDFFLTPDNTIYLNEINTMPGFTSISMFPQLVMHDGISLQELIERLIALAHERFLDQKALQHTYQ